MEKVVFFLFTDFFHHLDREQAGEGVGLLTAGATDPFQPKKRGLLGTCRDPPSLSIFLCAMGSRGGGWTMEHAFPR